ncbi:MAG: hypothetical protein AABZ53_16585 [Planctomycetota bacterium]
MKLSRTTIVALLSAAALSLSTPLLVQRIAAYYREHKPQLFAFQDLDTREFTYAGKPITLVDERSDNDNRTLVVNYGTETLRLKVSIPSRQHDILATHGLAAHRDWMRLLRFTEYTGRDFETVSAEMKSGKTEDRLVLVTRTQRAGVDPETWGELHKKDWTFDFYEFQTQGGFKSARLHYPTTKRGQQPKDGELAEGSWQYDAALMTMPKSGVPSQNFMNSGFKSMGWTFPVACFSSVALVVSLVMMIPVKRPNEPRASASETPKCPKIAIIP